MFKKETLAQVFSCEFCQISKNTFFTEHLWTSAFVDIRQSFEIFSENHYTTSKNEILRKRTNIWH